MSIKVDVKCCQRCGFDHDQLRFTQLIDPVDEWGHWAICPNTHQPILVKIDDDDEDDTTS